MPIYIKQDTVKFRQLQGNNYTGNYYGVDTISDTTTQEKIAAIDSAASTAISSVENAATTAVSNLNTATSAANTAATTLNNKVSTIETAIANVEDYAVDPTLTLANTAAEAKATGDAIGDLKSAVNTVNLTDSMFTVGAYGYSPYNVVTSTNRLRSVLIRTVSGATITSSTYEFYVQNIDDDYHEISRSGWVKKYQTLTNNFSIMIRKSGNADIEQSDISAMVADINVIGVAIPAVYIKHHRNLGFTKNAVSLDGKSYGANNIRVMSSMQKYTANDVVRVDISKKFRVYRYQTENMNSYIGDTDWLSGDYQFTNDVYALIVMGNPGDGAITNADDFYLYALASDNGSIYVDNKKDIVWYQRTLGLDGLTEDNSPTRAVTEMLFYNPGDMIRVTSGYKFKVFSYAGNYMASFSASDNDWRTSDYTFDKPTYARVLTAKSDATASIIVMEAKTAINIQYSNTAERGLDFVPDMLYVSPYNGLSKTEDLTIEADIANMTADDLYDLYDSLYNLNTTIFEKNLIGYASDENGGNDETLPIYEYVFKPASQGVHGNTHQGTTDLPTVLLTAGEHGGTEKSTSYSLYILLKQMYSDLDDDLNTLKNNFIFKVVPCIDPWGYNNGERTNARGVNLARNFTCFWSKGSSDATSTEYRGSEPASETETKAMIAWLEANQNAFAIIDFHNCGGTNQYSFICNHDEKMPYIYSNLLRRMNDYWRKRYSVSANANYLLGNDSIFEHHASVSDEASKYNIKYYVTAEVTFNGMDNTKYGSTCIEMGVDLIANLINAITQYEMA